MHKNISHQLQVHNDSSLCPETDRCHIAYSIDINRKVWNLDILTVSDGALRSAGLTVKVSFLPLSPCMCVSVCDTSHSSD